jgi:hypothetical protein
MTRLYVGRLLNVCALALLFWIGDSFSAVTRITDAKLCSEGFAGCYKISGAITQKDSKEVTLIANRIITVKKLSVFHLDSNGGDVEAAIKIGRELRRLGATATVINDAQCFSACVFVLAGATERIVGGKVGIHRPYTGRTDIENYDAVQAEQRRIGRLTKDYLEDMNISPLLYDAMVRVPPEKLRLLSSTELEEYGLNQTDLVEQELIDSAEARRYGLNKAAFLRRKAEVYAKCADEYASGGRGGGFAPYFRCRANIFSGRSGEITDIHYDPVK